MNTRKILMISIIGFAASLSSGLTEAGPPLQEERPPMSEEERRNVMQRLIEQMQKKEQANKQQAGQQPAEPNAPGAVPATVPPAAAAPPQVPSIVQRAPLASGQVQLSYDNADLFEFINQITDTLGITPVVVDPEVRGSVTIHSSAPMSKEELLPLFNLILKNNNAALVKQGGIYQILPISSGLKKGLDVIEHMPPEKPDSEKGPAANPETEPGSKANPPGEPEGGANDQTGKQLIQGRGANTPQAAAAGVGGGFMAQRNVTGAAPAQSSQAGAAGRSQTPTPSQGARLSTHVIRAEFVPVRDLVEPVKLFMTEGGVIMPYERLNMLIVTDYSDSISKILEIIRLLDDRYLDPDLIDLINIKYNASADVVDDLKKIFGNGSADSATGISFISLDRLNSILVMATSNRALGEVRRWIKELDATTGRSIQTFVYTVENSTASNIALILTSLYGGEGSSGGTGDTAASGRSTTPGGALGAAGTSGAFGGGTGGTAAGPFGTQSYQGSSGTAGSGGSGFMGGGVIGGGQQLGPRLNQQPTVSSRILRGGSFSGLQDTVRIVVDDINNSLIVQASAADYAYLLDTIKRMDVLPRQAIIDARIFEVELTDTLSFGVAADLQARSDGEHLTTGSLAATGALTASTFAFVGNSREILIRLNALRAKTRVRILEAPSVLALDGTMARIVVGSEVPYPGTSYVTTGGATSSVQYRDTGISLIVMPRISASGSVTLDIAQEVSSPGSFVSGQDLGPTFSKTSVATTLSVKDGETVAIAGLIRDSNSSSRSGVPFFSNIPLLGVLFGQTGKTANRTELLILITPHVIRTNERLQEMTQELKDSLRNVRKEVDSTDKEIREDIEKARQERAREQEKRNQETEMPAEKQEQ